MVAEKQRQTPERPGIVGLPINTAEIEVCDDQLNPPNTRGSRLSSTKTPTITNTPTPTNPSAHDIPLDTEPGAIQIPAHPIPVARLLAARTAPDLNGRAGQRLSAPSVRAEGVVRNAVAHTEGAADPPYVG
jgi:hypothetical protein